MLQETREAYNELKRIDYDAWVFVLKVYGIAERTERWPWQEKEAFDMLVTYYKNLTMNQLHNLHRLFPVVETLFS
ncbi:hypothetical protein GCK32_020665, partial [Trichostrongylus colubriformis]